MYKRVLLKLSGEQLAGELDGGIDANFCSWVAKEVKKVEDAGCQVVIMVGGGNYARGAQLEGHGIERVTADNIGMLATVMNALALEDIFKHNNIEARALSSIAADQVIDQFTHRRARSHLSKGRVVIVAGGTGRPYVTTDTAAVGLALEMGCEIVLKATKVDGVYDKDPAKYTDAIKLDTISFQNAVADESIKVMDKAAMGLAMEHDMKIVVFDAMKADNILKAANGESVGTIIN